MKNTFGSIGLPQVGIVSMALFLRTLIIGATATLFVLAFVLFLGDNFQLWPFDPVADGESSLLVWDIAFYVGSTLLLGVILGVLLPLSLGTHVKRYARILIKGYKLENRRKVFWLLSVPQPQSRSRKYRALYTGLMLVLFVAPAVTLAITAISQTMPSLSILFLTWTTS